MGVAQFRTDERNRNSELNDDGGCSKESRLMGILSVFLAKQLGMDRSQLPMLA